MNTRLDQPAQFLELGRDRVLVRLQGAQFLLRGTGVNDLAQLVPLLDGSRDISTIVGLLKDRYPAAGVRRTIELLLQRQRQPGSHPPSQEQKPLPFRQPKPAQVLWISPLKHTWLLGAYLSPQITGPQFRPPNGPPQASRRFFQLAEAEECGGESALSQSNFEGMDLAVLLPSNMSYGEILDVEKLALEAGCPLLLGMDTPLGFEIVPLLGTNLPCFACTQQFLFQSVLGGKPAFPALAPLRSQPWFTKEAPTVGPLMARAVMRTLQTLQDSRAPFTAQRLERSNGALRELSVQSISSCNTCSALPKSPQQLLSFESQQVKKPFSNQPPASDSPQKKGLTSIGIVGGGTAGYLTALALRMKHPQLKVTLIESPDVPIIGVGEATTPLMLQFLHVDLGLDMVDFFEQVLPTLKLGIRFDWGPRDTPFFHYPFGPVQLSQPASYDAHYGHISRQAMHMTAGTLPLWNDKGRGDTAWDCNIAYHLENRSFVHFLQKKARGQGVVYKQAHIQSVETTADGQQIQVLKTRCGETLSFDLFVDCSGFRALLMKHLQTPFHSFSKTLFTNRALIGKVSQVDETPPYTRATTMEAGWCWNTPQRDAHHCGYVYAADFLSEAEAEAEMRQLYPGLGAVKAVPFQSGRQADFWRGNVVAMGNAYGFVEPLESTALHMLIRQIGWLVQALPGWVQDPAQQKKLNLRAGAFWDYLCWFLGLHYRFNGRSNSPFWQTCRNQVDLSSHQHLLEIFRERGLLSSFPELWESLNIPDPLWGPEGIDLLLLAQGIKPGSIQTDLSATAWQDQVEPKKKAAAQALPQAMALELMNHQPELISQLAACYKKRGPAFS